MSASFVELDPGIAAGDVKTEPEPEPELTGVRLSRGTLAALDPARASHVLRDLVMLSPDAARVT